MLSGCLSLVKREWFHRQRSLLTVKTSEEQAALPFKSLVEYLTLAVVACARHHAPFG